VNSWNKIAKVSNQMSGSTAFLENYVIGIRQNIKVRVDRMLSFVFLLPKNNM